MALAEEQRPVLDSQPQFLQHSYVGSSRSCRTPGQSPRTALAWGWTQVAKLRRPSTKKKGREEEQGEASGNLLLNLQHNYEDSFRSCKILVQSRETLYVQLHWKRGNRTFLSSVTLRRSFQDHRLKYQQLLLFFKSELGTLARAEWQSGRRAALNCHY